MTDNDSEDDLPLATVARKHMAGDRKAAETITFISDDSFGEVVNSEPCAQAMPSKRALREAADSKDSDFPVEKLYEYQWPADKSGEFFLLQEHVIDYLGIKSFQRRFPDLERRAVTVEEREYLKEKGVVTELQCSLGLTALKTEDVCDLMLAEFPEKYQSYIRMVHRREMSKILKEQEAQRAACPSSKAPKYLRNALRETVRYNTMLNQQRMEERCAYFDLQTQIIHYPQKKRKMTPTGNKAGPRYPVALIPGQFQDFYKIYAPDELRSLPIKTVCVPPRLPARRVEEEIQSQREKPSSAELAGAACEDSLSLNEEEMANLSEDDCESNPLKKDPFCGICLKGPETNKRGIPEKLIHCSQCTNSGHPSCLDLNKHLVQVMLTYAWQCMECKVCTECLAPHDEDEMMFCDNCDRGYHSYCVGLKEIPKGRWVCSRCGQCSSCLASTPVDEGVGRWKSEFTKPQDGGEPEFLQLHCHSCSKLFRKGEFCPVCLKVYRVEDDLRNPMVCCDTCDRWIHTDCDGIDDHRYNELSKDKSSSYTCILCRGEKEERMDSFHKKNRKPSAASAEPPK